MSKNFMGLGCTKSFKLELADSETKQNTDIKFSVFEKNDECAVSITNNGSANNYFISFEELCEIRDCLIEFIGELSK